MDRNVRPDLIRSWTQRPQTGRQSTSMKCRYGEEGGPFAGPTIASIRLEVRLEGPSESANPIDEKACRDHRHAVIGRGVVNPNVGEPHGGDTATDLGDEHDFPKPG